MRISANLTAKVVQEACQQTLDDLYTGQEKLSNLSKANLKLEQQVDEVRSALSSWLAVCLQIYKSPTFI